jgi:hypothetical protein
MVANVIVFTERMDFKTLVETECKGITGFAPIVKDTFDELMSFLNLGSDVEILVVDDPQINLMKSLSLEKKIKNILVLSDTDFHDDKSKSFPKNAVESLINQIKTILNPNFNNQAGYISIPVDSLIHFKMLPFDLFVKITEDKFLKRIPANEVIDESTIQGFKIRGINELHFERKNNRDFSLMLLNNMINKVESDYSTQDAKSKATNEVFLTTKDIVQSVGLPPKVIQVCESVMERITSDVMSHKDNLSTYLSEAKASSQVNFQFRFIELTSFIASQMVDIINDGNKDEDMKTIVFASFFCDIALKSSSQLGYRSEESIEGIFSGDKRLVEKHAHTAFEIVSKYKNAPKLAGMIIKQHHGAMDGIGFPTNLSIELLSLSKCLIAAQELSYGMLHHPEIPTKQTIDEITKRYERTVIHHYLKMFQQSCG